MSSNAKRLFYERLNALGYEDYKSYLKSEHWKRYRKRILRRDGRCLACDGKPSVVHHKTYRRLGRERMEDAVALCGDCHKQLHEVHRKRGIPLGDFNAVLVIVNPAKRPAPEKPRKKRRKKGSEPRRRRAAYIEPLASVEPPPDAITNHPLFARRRIIVDRLSTGMTIDGLAREMKCSRSHLEQIVSWMAENERLKTAAVPNATQESAPGTPRTKRRAGTPKSRERSQGPSSPVALRMIARNRGCS